MAEKQFYVNDPNASITGVNTDVLGENKLVSKTQFNNAIKSGYKWEAQNEYTSDSQLIYSDEVNGVRSSQVSILMYYDYDNSYGYSDDNALNTSERIVLYNFNTNDSYDTIGKTVLWSAQNNPYNAAENVGPRVSDLDNIVLYDMFKGNNSITKIKNLSNYSNYINLRFKIKIGNNTPTEIDYNDLDIITFSPSQYSGDTAWVDARDAAIETVKQSMSNGDIKCVFMYNSDGFFMDVTKYNSSYNAIKILYKGGAQYSQDDIRENHDEYTALNNLANDTTGTLSAGTAFMIYYIAKENNEYAIYSNSFIISAMGIEDIALVGKACKNNTYSSTLDIVDDVFSNNGAYNNFEHVLYTYTDKHYIYPAIKFYSGEILVFTDTSDINEILYVSEFQNGQQISNTPTHLNDNNNTYITLYSSSGGYVPQTLDWLYASYTDNVTEHQNKNWHGWDIDPSNESFTLQQNYTNVGFGVFANNSINITIRIHTRKYLPQLTVATENIAPNVIQVHIPYYNKLNKGTVIIDGRIVSITNNDDTTVTIPTYYQSQNNTSTINIKVSRYKNNQEINSVTRQYPRSKDNNNNLEYHYIESYNSSSINPDNNDSLDAGGNLVTITLNSDVDLSAYKFPDPVKIAMQFRLTTSLSTTPGGGALSSSTYYYSIPFDDNYVNNTREITLTTPYS